MVFCLKLFLHTFVLAIFFLSSVIFTNNAHAATWLDGWANRKQISISNTNVDADLTSFPALVKVTNDADLSGALATGYDIRFTDSDGTSLLKYERESWSGGGGSSVTAVFWVKVPIISHAANTIIYMYYGKADATDGQEASNTWNSSYKLVSHMPNDAIINNRPAIVINRQVFYNNSAFDTVSDTDAIATDKTGLFPGQLAIANLANYTSYNKGINGLMIDVSGLANTNITASDFEFKMGNIAAISTWTTAATPSSITVSDLGGGVSRIKIIWPDYDPANIATTAVAKQWLQVKLKASVNTGLVQDDLFYFGNAIGETGYANVKAVSGVDLTSYWANVSSIDQSYTQLYATSSAVITNRYDHNRDGKVDVTDKTIVTSNFTVAGTTALKMITMDMQSGIAVPDSTTNAVNGTNYSMVTTSGKILGGTSFTSGQSQYIDFGSPSATRVSNTATLDLWFKSGTTTAFFPMLNQFVASTFKGIALLGNYSNVATPNYVALATGNGTTTEYKSTSSTTMSDGQWHHLVGVFNAGNYRIFVDGQKLLDANGSNTSISYATNNLLIGNNLTGYSSMDIDELRISETNLSDAWIKFEYNNENSSNNELTFGTKEVFGANSSSNSTTPTTTNMVTQQKKKNIPTTISVSGSRTDEQGRQTVVAISKNGSFSIKASDPDQLKKVTLKIGNKTFVLKNTNKKDKGTFATVLDQFKDKIGKYAYTITADYGTTQIRQKGTISVVAPMNNVALNDVNKNFREAFGRTPTKTEWTKWAKEVQKGITKQELQKKLKGNKK